MKYIFFLLITNALVCCKGNTDPKEDVAGRNRYELVESWPESKDIQLGQPTGIGVGKNDHLFIFHRAGRKWTEPGQYLRGRYSCVKGFEIQYKGFVLITRGDI